MLTSVESDDTIKTETLLAELNALLACLPPACDEEIRSRTIAAETVQDELIIAEIRQSKLIRTEENLLPAEALEPWMRRATGGGRKLIQALFKIGKKPKGKVRRAIPKKGGGWKSKYDWVYDCEYCLFITSSPAVAGLGIKTGELRIACDGGEFMCTSGTHTPRDVFQYVIDVCRPVPPGFTARQRRH